MVCSSTHCGRRTSPAQLAGLPPYDQPQYGSVRPRPAIVRMDPRRSGLCPAGIELTPKIKSGDAPTRHHRAPSRQRQRMSAPVT
jgi:hypothetical protein